MDEGGKKIVIFDLWKTLIFGTKDSAVSIFYKEITGKGISYEQFKDGMLIKDPRPRIFLEKFLHLITPSNQSSMVISLKNPCSPLYKKIIRKFQNAVKNDFNQLRWMPGAVELLESLKDKYTLVAVSNLWSYQKRHLLKTLNLRKYFDACLFSCDLGMNKNQILQNISSLLNMEIKDILYVGNSYEYDIIPAVNASLSAIRLISEDKVIFPKKTERLIDEEFENTQHFKIKTPEIAISDYVKKPSVIIAIPPFYKLLGSHNNRMNLGAAHLSAYLDSKGYSNKIYHCDSKVSEKYITRYQMVFNSIEFYEKIETDPSYDEFEDYYKKMPAEIAFVTCGDILNPSFDSGNWDSTKKVAKIIRKANPKAFIVAFGPEIGASSEDFDLIVHGEIESLVDQIMARSVRGSVSGELLSDGELNNFPLFNIKNIATSISSVSLDTVIWRRGCAGTCDFCRVAQINQGRVRRKSVDSVVQEMRLRYDKLNVKDFYIVDANFTSDREYITEFCCRLGREFRDISWRTESRFDTLDKELLGEMKKAGCSHLKLGLENALHEKHQVKTKKVSIDSAEEWIRSVQKLGIKCVVYLMLGGKWFTPEQYMQMYRNAVKLEADGYTVSLFNPYPNTPAGISQEEWDQRGFTGSHLDIRLVDFWKIPIDILDKFFKLELSKDREDKNIRTFVY